MRSLLFNMTGHCRRLALVVACGVLLACTTDGTQGSSSGASNSGVTFREVMGDFCPPAQAMKGNC
ncbi:hypothetical protein [Lacisediminimonas sp.]|uniref:hypothetical protein n=1 Tax=Lacisediminimonas sp. TaxID=3060582 RepID=UPI00271D7201|nr:hypothetical protein [Lacisediminimonas sp.]MDO8298440.1 hypothetical protein [Lacisediminimonas sp.]